MNVVVVVMFCGLPSLNRFTSEYVMLPLKPYG